MKKVSLCIGAFLVLFLISGVYNAQSQDYAVLNQMNGKWLKFNGSVKGYDFGVFHDTAGKADKFQGTLNQIYACVSYNPANETADMYVYDKAGTQTVGAFYTGNPGRLMTGCPGLICTSYQPVILIQPITQMYSYGHPLSPRRPFSRKRIV